MSQSFLSLVASDLIQRGIDISKTTVVFPNRRAAVFFNQCLYEQLQKPFWAPEYPSITELWQRFTTQKISQPLALNYQLYEVYQQILQTDESFDDFFYWGELLIRDFDDIDKHLVDARLLFTNLQDIKAMQNPLDYLSDQQIEALQEFFAHFEPDKTTQLKQRFMNIWSVLYTVYETYRERLRDKNLAYEGLLMRSVIESQSVVLDAQQAQRTYVFAGFNVLNTCEERLFEWFKNSANTLFYWDYDIAYIDNPDHQAGVFMRRNMQRFGNAITDTQLFNNLSNPLKSVTFVEAPSNSAQVRYADKWLNARQQDKEKATETAIVLCDEQLLVPLMCSLSGGETTNVTMGYPITGSTVITTINNWFTQQENTNANDIIKELAAWIKTQLAQIEPANTPYKTLYTEGLYQVLEELKSVNDILTTYALTMTQKSLQRLLQQFMSTMKVPLFGEPVLGTQIMGVLETRTIDFKNVLLLSTNEGILPRSNDDASFIPFHLRQSFGMTTMTHKNALYAYYFYRLMQRSENICLLYSTSQDPMKSPEMSRFMLQLLVSNQWTIQRKSIQSEAIRLSEPRHIQIASHAGIRAQLLQTYGHDPQHGRNKALTPSAINAFIDCKLKFYFRYIALLYAPEQVADDIDQALFGSIFHRSVELLYLNAGQQLYSDKDGKLLPITEPMTITAEQLQPYLQPQQHLPFIDQALKELFFKIPTSTSTPHYNGSVLIKRNILSLYIQQLLKIDSTLGSVTFLGLEKNVSIPFFVNNALTVNLGGKIDRLDRVNGELRVIDYKTGGKLIPQKNTAESLAKLFVDIKDRPKNNLQSLIYSLIVSQLYNEPAINPCLLHINTVFNNYQHDPSIFDSDDRALDFRQPITEHLQLLIAEMFDTNTVFDATSNDKNCTYCDYRGFCQKQASSY
ncbi:hypothetical protein FACS1894201_05650 [Bacteroidia bacterium]|nr:hypothetical protein FACS1894201_05650 [Bacteroidia bacterium]